MPDPSSNIEFDTFVTLLGGGELNAADLANCLKRAPALVAADGGAEAALWQGAMPEAVIGDFDSLSPEAAARIPKDRLFVLKEQDSTDFEKALRLINAPGILALGFTGGRTDHELAVWHGLMTQNGPSVIVIGAEDLVFLAPPRLGLTLPPYTRFSLFPMGPVSARSTGLKWPIEGLDFAPGRTIGTSNLTTDRRVELAFSARNMLVILPKIHLDAVMTALF